MNEDMCTCGSGIAYAECCEPYIKGVKNAPTAEALMRSRYTAYVVHAVDYIMETIHEDTRSTINRDYIKKWSEKAKWLGLKIIAVEGGGAYMEGKVEFEATYEMDGLHKIHHETALFKKVGNCWFYVKGEVVPKTEVRVGKKIGRNDPCPCGSGKKYKHCCGR